MVLGAFGALIYWLLIRRFMAPRIRVWIFILVLLAMPLVDFALAMTFAVAGGLIARYTLGG